VGSDFLSSDERWRNLRHAQISDFVEPAELPEQLMSGRLRSTSAIFHQGACSDTTARNATFVLERNYHGSVALAAAAQHLGVPFVYASSASVYGNSFEPGTTERSERPINLYAYSKLLFDRYVRANLMRPECSPVIGLRYFNVYGEGEAHKGRMASVVYHFREQALASGEIHLFEGSGGFGDGEQCRDFVYVDDIVRVNLFFGLEQPTSGIVDVGTGEARPFNAVAEAVRRRIPSVVSYVPFPADLEGRYQHWTAADLTGLHKAGFPQDHEFTPIEVGIVNVLDWLEADDAAG
jgi:ADP-L-glycero-D-manno-heptose 6-epimerase